MCVPTPSPSRAFLTGARFGILCVSMSGLCIYAGPFDTCFSVQSYMLCLSLKDVALCCRNICVYSSSPTTCELKLRSRCVWRRLPAPSLPTLCPLRGVQCLSFLCISFASRPLSWRLQFDECKLHIIYVWVFYTPLSSIHVSDLGADHVCHLRAVEGAMSRGAQNLYHYCCSSTYDIFTILY